MKNLHEVCLRKKHVVNQLNDNMVDDIIEYAKSLIKQHKFDEFEEFYSKIRFRLFLYANQGDDYYFKPGIYYGMKLEDFKKSFGYGEWVFDTIENVKKTFRVVDDETGIVHSENSGRVLGGQNFVYPLIVDGKKLHDTVMVDLSTKYFYENIDVHSKSRNKEVLIVSHPIYGYYFGSHNLSDLGNFNKIRDDSARVDFVFEDNLLSQVKIKVGRKSGIEQMI
ncbi:hypothetical protein N9I21_01575 [Crocinitomicaceae bacterium]|nr:hypothetical protein [Crocinitomicaceae bacterium]